MQFDGVGFEFPSNQEARTFRGVRCQVSVFRFGPAETSDLSDLEPDTRHLKPIKGQLLMD